MQRLGYFVFNKISDYRRGYLQNMELVDSGIRPGQQAGKAAFISRVMDSREQQTVWHRMRIHMGEVDTVFRLSVYATDEAFLRWQGEKVSLERFIHRTDITLEKKTETLAPLLQKKATGTDDVLLHEVKGRYLFFIIEMYRQQGDGTLSDIWISFPAYTWMRYLPEIYQSEDRQGFLERYLGIFQTMYEDLEEKIRMSADQFDMDTASAGDLQALAQWLDITETYVWSESQMRRLLKNAVSLYKRRGTRQGIIDFVALYTGEKPFLVEQHQLGRFRRNERLARTYERLYGKDPYTFTLMVRAETVPALWQQRALAGIMEEVKPAQMEMNLIVLKPYIFMDQYSYLGINSVLGRYTGLSLDGHSAVSFTVLGSEQERRQS